MKFKQKLLLISSIVLFSLCTTNVEAAGNILKYRGATASLDLGSAYEHVVIPTISRIKTSDQDHTALYPMTLNTSIGNTVTAYCLDSGKEAHTGDVYKIVSMVKSDSILSRIYNYSKSGAIPTFKRTLISQMLVWSTTQKVDVDLGYITIETSLILNKSSLTAALKEGIYSHYCEWDKYEEQCDTYSRAGNGYYLVEATKRGDKDTTSTITGIEALRNLASGTNSSNYYSNYVGTDTLIKNIANGIWNYPAYDEDLCIWESTTSSGNQKLLAPCSEKVDENPSCYNASGTKIDLTACVATCQKTGATETACISSCTTTNCPNITPTPSKPILYGEVETKEIYKTCSASGDDAIQGYTYEYYNPNKIVTEKTDLASGELTKKIGSYCAVYCLEDTAEIFPGNVNTPVGVGSYLIWPTSAATSKSKYGNDYALHLKGTKSCKIELAYGNTEYDKYINTTSDPVADLTTLVNAAKSSAGAQYVGRTYETYRTNTPDGKSCNSFIFTNNCQTDRDALTAFDNSVNYSKNNGLYNTMKSKDSALASAQSTYNTYLSACNRKDPKNAACAALDGTVTTQLNAARSAADSAGAAFAASGYSESAWEGIITQHDKLQNTLNACQSALGACNSYANQVQAAINVTNEVVNCANYDFNGTEKEIYNWQTHLNVSWADKEYGDTLNDGDLQKNTSSTCTGCSSLGVVKIPTLTSIYNLQTLGNNKIVEVNNALKVRTIDIQYDTEYSLPTTGKLLYNYVNKKTLKAVSDLSAAGDNYVTIGYSNMPISYEADTGIKQDLSITDISFGSDGKYKGNNYVCNYEVSEVTSSCVCPEGTKHAGESLVCMINDNNMTCADAQAAYCDSTSITDFDTTCDKFCPDNPSIDLTACISAGKTYDECSALLCDTTYRCKNSNKVGGYMDITACVQTKVAQGASTSEALNICDATVCPLNGVKVIYRTISLANPFPGKDVSGLVSGFNTTVKGRFPGVNWNSTSLVKDLILDNRNVSGEEIYKTNPLYTFVLTPEVIKEIRSYNDSKESAGGYADYTLDCKNKNSTACVSDFVHDPIYGLTEGTCADATGKNTFYQCTN